MEQDGKSSNEIKIDKISWYVALIIWGGGAFVIYLIWEWQKTVAGGLGEAIATLVQIVSFFYFLSLFPIKHFIFDYLSNR
ncbi:hypothetical protein [Pseudomonas sp. BIC9C]|uniref:hypothetical protein n=1 Tax=Pseudomonas sp. BIC9C TaxID=3078458 RepID=UPI002AD28202|nr:hypothetical protein [Pseudomonas sp. BIC9C]